MNVLNPRCTFHVRRTYAREKVPKRKKKDHPDINTALNKANKIVGKNKNGQRRKKIGGGQASRPREGDFHAPPSPIWGTDARSFAGTS